jgi:hypothetical protein
MARSYAAADACQLLHYAMVNGPLSDASSRFANALHALGPILGPNGNVSK